MLLWYPLFIMDKKGGILIKKAMIKWSIIIAGLIVIVCYFKFSSGRWVLPSQVKGVQLEGYSSCDDPAPRNMELSDSEARDLLFHYNLAGCEGSVTADSCTSEFGFTIYLKDGSYISVSEAGDPRMTVSPLHGDRYWIKSEALADYVRELVEQYDLTVL